MSFFAPESDSSSGYFGSVDSSTLNLPDLFRAMPLGVPPASIGVSPLAIPPEPSKRDGTKDDQVAAAGDLKCQGFPAGCHGGGSYGVTAMYNIGGDKLCWDCAVKKMGIGAEPGPIKVQILSPYLILPRF